MAHRWTDEHLDAMRRIGDGPADAVVEHIFATHGIAAVDQLFAHLRDPSSPLPGPVDNVVSEYFASTGNVPSWADHALIERAQHLFQAESAGIVLSLFCSSLPWAYSCARGAQVLIRTGRLSGRPESDLKRRILETGTFLLAVTRPGGLEPAAAGIRTTQEVRLIHAAIRHRITAAAATHPQAWNGEWGVPINQEDLAGTLMSFAYVVAEPVPRLGIELSKEDQEAYLHLWRVVGHILGVRSEVIPDNIDDAGHLVAAIRRRQVEASPQGETLEAALLTWLSDISPRFVLRGIHADLTRYLLQEPAIGAIGLPPPRWVNQAVIRLASDAEHILSRLVRRLGWRRRWQERAAADLLSAVIAYESDGRPAQLHMPGPLKSPEGLP